VRRHQIEGDRLARRSGAVPAAHRCQLALTYLAEIRRPAHRIAPATRHSTFLARGAGRRSPSVETIQERTFDGCPSVPRERPTASSAFCAAAPGESAATSTEMDVGSDRSTSRSSHGCVRTWITSESDSSARLSRCSVTSGCRRRVGNSTSTRQITDSSGKGRFNRERCESRRATRRFPVAASLESRRCNRPLSQVVGRR
jgi:hypothetical protein